MLNRKCIPHSESTLIYLKRVEECEAKLLATEFGCSFQREDFDAACNLIAESSRFCNEEVFKVMVINRYLKFSIELLFNWNVS